MTRDIDWGVEVPVDDLGPGKRIYVWFDAVIGYLSAAKEWASMTDDADSWRKWWRSPTPSRTTSSARTTSRSIRSSGRRC